MSLALVALGAVGALVLMTQVGGGPAISGTTSEAEDAARLLVKDVNAPLDITSVDCSDNTDPWAESGFSPYRCEVVTQSADYVCDAGETLSEGFTLACDEASHFEAIKNDTLALAQSALDRISEDGYWSAYIDSLAARVTVGSGPLCKVLRYQDGGNLGDAISVSLYAVVTSTGEGLGSQFIVQRGEIGEYPYIGSNVTDMRPSSDSPEWWLVGACEVTASGLSLTHFIRPEKTVDVALSATGTSSQVPLPSSEASEQAPESRPVFSAGEMRFVRGFKTPSGNIVCGQYETGIGTGEIHNWLTCGVVSADEAWQLVDSKFEASVFGLRGANLPQASTVPTLGYGKKWRTESFQCLSRPATLRCENGIGNGFSLSREERDGW